MTAKLVSSLRPWFLRYAIHLLFAFSIVAASLAGSGSAEAQATAQIALNAAHLDGLIKSFEEVRALEEKLPAGPKSDAAVEALVKKYGFKNMAEWNAVYESVSIVIEGMDEETKKYVGPGHSTKQAIAEVKADKTLSAAERAEQLKELNEDLADVQPVQFPGNIELVTRYYDRLDAALSEKD